MLNTIIMLLGSGVVILIGSMLLVQTRHKRNMARVQKINALVAQNKKLQNILRTLPPQYMTKEMRDFIYQVIIQNFKQILKLKPENPRLVRNDIEQLTQEREKSRLTPKDIGPAQINSIESANMVRTTLKSLFATVKDAYAEKKIVGSDAERLIQQIEARMMNAAIQFYEAQISTYRTNNRFTEAASFARKMVDLLSKSKRKELYKEQIVRAESLLTELKAQMESNNAEKREERKEQMENQLGKFDEAEEDALSYSHYNH